MPRINSIAALGLTRVGLIEDARKNGWSRLGDKDLVLRLYKMAQGHPDFLYVFLTRDTGFISDAKCKSQHIDIEYGNLRIAVLSWEELAPVIKRTRITNIASLPREIVLKILKDAWPFILERVSQNW